MLTEYDFSVYRCPIDPTRQAKIILDDIHIRCERCKVEFKSREGIPNFLVSDAILPENCSSIKDLPCWKSGKK